MFQALIISAAAVLVIIDQITKQFARSFLETGSIVIIPGVFEFALHTNTGIAFGMFEGYIVVFSIITAVILAVVLVIILSKRFSEHKAFNIAGVMIVAGGTGNLIDRVFRGGVTDFMYFSLIDFPVFNFADTLVVVGSSILLIFFLFFYKEDSGRMFGGDKVVIDGESRDEPDRSSDFESSGGEKGGETGPLPDCGNELREVSDTDVD